jgi:hypothetical protein
VFTWEERNQAKSRILGHNGVAQEALVRTASGDTLRKGHI